MKFSNQWKTRIARTNLAGPSNIVRADSSIFQIIWFWVYIVSVLFTVYLITESLFKYMKCQVNTNVRRKTVTELDFPKITFCNRNPFSSDYFLDLYNKTSVTLEEEQYYVLIQFESHMKNTSGRYLTLAEKQNMSDLEGMIISCMFKNKPCTFKDDFISFFDTFYLNCFSFNSGIDSLGRSISSK